MSHDDAFAAFRERREEERKATVRVTWRKVSVLTGGGYSGLGPDRQLVYVGPRRGLRGERPVYPFGAVEDGKRVEKGERVTLHAAKEAAAELFATRPQS